MQEVKFLHVNQEEIPSWWLLSDEQPGTGKAQPARSRRSWGTFASLGAQISSFVSHVCICSVLHGLNFWGFFSRAYVP